MEQNRKVFESVAESYTELALMPAERVVLERMRERIAGVEMLDLGVGSGRTAYTFAALVERYVGIDYSPRMVELARQLVGGDERVELRLGDARELGNAGGPFDFALFSFNGIDAVGHEDRLRILRGVSTVLKPEGSFLFSSHSLNALPLSRRRRRGRGARRSLLRDAYAVVDGARFACRIDAANRALDLEAARRIGHATVCDNAHGFSIEAYYVDPRAQLEQLDECGLRLLCAFDAAGEEVDPTRAGRDPWLSYLCAPA